MNAVDWSTEKCRKRPCSSATAQIVMQGLEGLGRSLRSVAEVMSDPSVIADRSGYSDHDRRAT